MGTSSIKSPKLVRRHALFAGAQQPRCEKPLVQRNMAALIRGADCGGKLFAAILARIDARPCCFSPLSRSHCRQHSNGRRSGHPASASLRNAAGRFLRHGKSGLSDRRSWGTSTLPHFFPATIGSIKCIIAQAGVATLFSRSHPAMGLPLLVSRRADGRAG